MDFHLLVPIALLCLGLGVENRLGNVELRSFERKLDYKAGLLCWIVIFLKQEAQALESLGSWGKPGSIDEKRPRISSTFAF